MSKAERPTPKKAELETFTPDYNTETNTNPRRIEAAESDGDDEYAWPPALEAFLDRFQTPEFRARADAMGEEAARVILPAVLKEINRDPNYDWLFDGYHRRQPRERSRWRSLTILRPVPKVRWLAAGVVERIESRVKKIKFPKRSTNPSK